MLVLARAISDQLKERGCQRASRSWEGLPRPFGSTRASYFVVLERGKHDASRPEWLLQRSKNDDRDRCGRTVTG